MFCGLGSSRIVVSFTLFLMIQSSINIPNLPQFAISFVETLRNFPPVFFRFSQCFFRFFRIFFRNPPSKLSSSLEATLHHPICQGRKRNMPGLFRTTSTSNFSPAKCIPSLHLKHQLKVTCRNCSAPDLFQATYYYCIHFAYYRHSYGHYFIAYLDFSWCFG